MYGTISILHISDIYKQYTPQPPMYDVSGAVGKILNRDSTA